MFYVFLREADDTWTPFKNNIKTLGDAVKWADAKGIDYEIEHTSPGRSEIVASRIFGKRVVRRPRKS